MPVDMAKNSPITKKNFFKGVTIKDMPDTYTTVNINGRTVTPYIYSYSTNVDPVARANHGFLEYDNSLYVFGGHSITMARYLPLQSPSDYSNDLWRYNKASLSWSNIVTTNTPVARTGFAFFTHSRFAYLLFGFGKVNNSLTHIDQLHSYDFSSFTWTLRTTTGDPRYFDRKPEARHNFGYTLVGNRLYICGGIKTTSMTEADDMWVLDLLTFRWTYLLSHPNITKNGFALIELNNILYIMMGETNFTIINGIFSYGLSNGVLSIVKPNTSLFDPLVEPGPIKLHRCFKLGITGHNREVPSIFCLGGFTPSFVNQGKVRLYHFDVSKSQWTLITDVALPYTKDDMNSIAAFGCSATGSAFNITGPRNRPTYSYEVFVDDGYSGNIGLNYHTGLWRIVINYNTRTRRWFMFSRERMNGKGFNITDTLPNTFTVNNITTALTTSPIGTVLQYTTRLSSSNVFLETLIVRP